MKPRHSLLLFTLFFAFCAGAQKAPATKSGDFVIKDFHFHSGEVLPELRLHYNTLGTPARGEDGKVTNAVLMLHGTSGSGNQYLQDSFMQAMYGPGSPSTSRAGLSSSPIASATANPPNPATPCMPNSRIMTTTT